MINKLPNGYWTKEKCFDAAKLCESRKEFECKFRTAYKKCCINGWIDKACQHMVLRQYPSGYWQNKENCKNAIQNCKTLKEFREKYSTAYNVVRKRGWYEELGGQLIIERDIHKWNSKDSIQQEALKYSSRSEFATHNGSAYQAAFRLGIIDEVCSHMSSRCDYYGRGIYAFEFDDHHVYVGLTYNFVKRRCEHISQPNSQVFKYMNYSGLIPSFRILHDYIDEKVAVNLENEYLNKYINAGWTPLNVQTPGNLGGGNSFYSHKRIMEFVNECETLSEFRHKYDQAYQTARKHKWLTEIKAILPTSVNQYGSFQNNKEDIIKFAKRCKTYREFYLGNPSATKYAKRHGFINEIYTILPPKQSNRGINKYTKDNINEIVSKCNNYIDFVLNHGGAYHAAMKNGWLEEIESKLQRTIHKTYTKENIINIAFQCSTYQEFVYRNGSVYNAAIRLHLLPEIQKIFNFHSHIKKYTYSDIIESAKKCHSYREFQKLSGLYNAARINGWLTDIEEILPRQFHKTYTKNSVLEIAQKCLTYKEFSTKHTGAYNAARVNNWMQEIEQILPKTKNRPYTKTQALYFAQKCQTYTEFIKKHKYIYKAACKKGWLDEIRLLFIT